MPLHAEETKTIDKDRENIRVDLKVVKEGMPVVSTEVYLSWHLPP
jgi:hypothetical protein